MKQGTIFLKLTILSLGLFVLMLFLLGGSWIIRYPVHSTYQHILYPILTGIGISVIPFYLALWKAYQLLQYIDANQAFSLHSVDALKIIRNCAAAVSMIYLFLMPFVYLLADKEDAPGLIFIGLIPLFAAMVIAVFAAVLKRLLQEAIAIKTEHDLTV